ncbi:hypothetical protein GN958_ATG19377 [Phytophthora infestans]|uniref:Uncharacterized protein n=1 Tax=Phytophthora infestans TaxID=4787 RepID=A0A8S9TTX5_PHYIN|nr:hypothetical protein GN958_ATG19377 [Phytophthora infestans]
MTQSVEPPPHWSSEALSLFDLPGVAQSTTGDFQDDTRYADIVDCRFWLYCSIHRFSDFRAQPWRRCVRLATCESQAQAIVHGFSTAEVLGQMTQITITQVLNSDYSLNEDSVRTLRQAESWVVP